MSIIAIAYDINGWGSGGGGDGGDSNGINQYAYYVNHEKAPTV